MCIRYCITHLARYAAVEAATLVTKMGSKYITHNN